MNNKTGKRERIHLYIEKEDKKIEKVKDFANKAEQSVDQFVEKATDKTKETMGKVKEKVRKDKK